MKIAGSPSIQSIERPDISAPVPSSHIFQDVIQPIRGPFVHITQCSNSLIFQFWQFQFTLSLTTLSFSSASLIFSTLFAFSLPMIAYTQGIWWRELFSRAILEEGSPMDYLIHMSIFSHFWASDKNCPVLKASRYCFCKLRDKCSVCLMDPELYIP